MSHLLSDMKVHWRQRRDLAARERALQNAVTYAERNELEVIFARAAGSGGGAV